MAERWSRSVEGHRGWKNQPDYPLATLNEQPNVEPTNVRYRSGSGHDADITECPLMTLSDISERNSCTAVASTQMRHCREMKNWDASWSLSQRDDWKNFDEIGAAHTVMLN